MSLTAGFKSHFNLDLSRSMRNAVLTALVAILLVASLGIGYLSGNDSRATETATSVSTLTVTSTSTSTSTETSVLTSGLLVPVSSASALDPLTGLSLRLNVSVMDGVQLVVTAYEFNTLDRDNNVSYGSDWPNASLFQWNRTPCYIVGGDGYVEGYEILQGNYGSGNFTDGEALWLQPENPMNCGVSGGIPGAPESNSYSFGPLSREDTLSGRYVGYWVEGEDYTQFTAGTYTVLAGDQWGQVAILHFVVAGS